MNCPYCGEELVYHDYYMKGYNGPKVGDIYKCPSESNGEKCESQIFNSFFYTDINDNFREGYPC